MAASFRKKRSNVDLVLQDAHDSTAHGGQLIVDALAKDFGLWEKIRACGCMDPRKDKSRGFSPEAIVSQILFSFCSGGISLADAGRLSDDKALGQLLGMERWADESTLGEWLRAQDKESLNALWAIIREFVGWVLGKAKPGRVRHGGQLEVFFDDTQIEVDGRCFKGTAVNYEGVLSYSWQTLWVGPFLADGEWGPGSRGAGIPAHRSTPHWKPPLRFGKATRRPDGRTFMPTALRARANTSTCSTVAAGAGR